MLNKEWKVLTIFRDPDTNEVKLVEFECDYTSPDFPGQVAKHSGQTYLAVEPTGPTEADFIAALEATFAPQAHLLDEHQYEMLRLRHIQANAVQVVVNPAPEVLRPLTAREIRLTLIHYGISPSMVTSMLEAITDQTERETAITEWEYATSYARDHALIAHMATAFQLSEAQVDTMWRYGMSLTYEKATA